MQNIIFFKKKKFNGTVPQVDYFKNKSNIIIWFAKQI